MEKITKLEMYSFLVDSLGLDEETVDVLIQVMGDTTDTYKRILHKLTPYKTYEEAFMAYQTI